MHSRIGISTIDQSPWFQDGVRDVDGVQIQSKVALIINQNKP